MCQNGSVHSTLVDKIYILASQIVHTIGIDLFLFQNHFFRRLFYIDHRLKHDPCAVLDELAHGVQIRRQIYGSRENTLLVFALALAE